MPGVLLQPAPFIDSRSGRTPESLRYFFVILTVTFRDRRKVRWTQQAPLVFFISRGGVPESRTGRAEKPMPSASDPSTRSGRLWTGDRRKRDVTARTPRAVPRPSRSRRRGPPPRYIRDGGR